jgi:hypothetical protein
MPIEILGQPSTPKTAPQLIGAKRKMDSRLVQRAPNGQILYAVIGNAWTGSKKLGRRVKFLGPVYLHASDQASAEFQFKRLHYREALIGVTAAPAIGFFVHDNHGDVLSTGGARPGVRRNDEHDS